MNLQGGTFVMQDEVTSTISLDTVIHENIILEPFPSGISISSLVFSGEITLHSKSSLVRIILVDIHNHEYLIFETYPILAGSSESFIEKTGEETSFLNNIIPFSIEIELIDASIHLKELLFSEEDASQKHLAPEVLKFQSQSKIDRINKHIREAGLKWVASETSISRLTYQEKKQIFGGNIPNLQGFEYYSGGVFVLQGTEENLASTNVKSTNSVQADSQFVSEFSWRNRHGQDWVTPVKNQGGCNSCWAFAPVAATELLVNLYYNRHLDYDLSEQNLISCTAGSCSGGTHTAALNYLRDYGVVLEECFSYEASDLLCKDSCGNSSERIQISDYTTFFSEEYQKRSIISGAAIFHLTDWSHYMQSVGFKTIEQGDSLFVRNSGTESWITFENDHPLIGRTAWLCKNSWGTEWGDSGYVYIIGNNNDLPLYYLHEPVSSKLMDLSDILCVDEDGDGFYSWGIGPKPSHCPDCPDQPDGDDSDPCIGPMDEYGYFSSNPPRPVTKNTTIIYCSVIPDLYAEGRNIQWYSDQQLSNLVHSGNTFPTGHTEKGDYTYYTTQTSPECGESKATEVTLSIIPPLSPQGHDTLIFEGEQGIISVTGEPNAVFNWYDDPSLDTLLDQGGTFNTGLTSSGTFVFYVTQTICSLESEPDTVVLRIRRYDQTILIPDTTFENSLIEQGVDTSNDGRISYGEAVLTRSLDVSGKGIYNLTGIEAFMNLDTLDCRYNNLSSLDVSYLKELEYLHCGLNQLTSLDISKNLALSHLECWYNGLTSLDVSKNLALSHLSCGSNGLTDLDVTKNTALTSLWCYGNQLINLDVSNNPILTNLDCRRNQLTTLVISNNMALERLVCGSNQLTRLDLSDNIALTELYCPCNPISSLDLTQNLELKFLHVGAPYFPHVEWYGSCDSSFSKLTTLDVSNNTALEELHCAGMQLSRLDVSKNTALKKLGCPSNQLKSLIIPDNTAIVSIACENNQLTELNISNNALLKHLNCSYNQLTSLNASNCASLSRLYCNHNQLASLDVSNDTALIYLWCSENQLYSLDVSKNTAITLLYCYSNQLASLDVSNNNELVQLWCSNNLLTSLDITNSTVLESLNCEDNQLISLDVSSSPALTSMHCGGNTLTSLDVSSNPVLESLGCRGNLLTTLDISSNAALGNLYCGRNQLTSLDVSNNPSLRELSCGRNQLTSLNLCTNDSLEWLVVQYMPTLDTIYVRETFKTDVRVYDSGSPNVVFSDCAATGMVKKYHKNDYKLYPNPANDLLTIETSRPGQHSIEITSQNGKLLYTDRMEGPVHQIDLSSFEKGLYFITVRFRDYVRTEKIIKQ